MFVELPLQGPIQIAGVIETGEIVDVGELAIHLLTCLERLLALVQGQMGSYPGQQLLLGGGLDDVILGTCTESADDVFLVVARGHKDDRDFTGAGIGLEPLAGFNSRYSGHIDVQKDQVRL